MMPLKDAVLYLLDNFVGTLAAIAVVAAAVGKIRPVGTAVKRFVFRELYEANDKQDKRLDSLEMHQLKQIICDRRLPDGDRLNAGDLYTGRGGNGEIKMIYEALQEAAKKRRLEEWKRAEAEQAAQRREP
jgi:hypothetical protein